MARTPKSSSRPAWSKGRACHQDLFDFVDQTHRMYNRTDASRLWNTITAYLPLDKAHFDVRRANGRRVGLGPYAKWQKATPMHNHRRHGREVERRGWWLSLELLEHFKKYAEHLTPEDISEYGPMARELLTDFLKWLKSSRVSKS